MCWVFSLNKKKEWKGERVKHDGMRADCHADAGPQSDFSDDGVSVT